MYFPTLDPSSDPTSSSSSLSIYPDLRKMLQRSKCGFKLRKLNHAVEDEDGTKIESTITQENNLVSQPEAEETRRMSAKSQLYELCSVRHWKAPTYESIAEGPCHMTLFTVKVTIEVKEDSRRTVLECFGNPQHKKKIAAEQAAEAALWYLKYVGHTLQTEEVSRRRGCTKPI